MVSAGFGFSVLQSNPFFRCYFISSKKISYFIDPAVKEKSRYWQAFIFSKAHQFYLMFFPLLKKPFSFFRKLSVFAEQLSPKNKTPLYTKTQSAPQATDASSVLPKSADGNKNALFVFKEDPLLNEEKDISDQLKPEISSQKQENHLSFKKEAAADEPFNKKKEENCPAKKERAFISAELPSPDILSDSPFGLSKKSVGRMCKDLSKKLTDKLAQFSIRGEITAVKTGPAVVLFEFKPEDHVKVSRIREMESDLSLALSSESVRITAPIPGRDVCGD